VSALQVPVRRQGVGGRCKRKALRCSALSRHCIAEQCPPPAGTMLCSPPHPPTLLLNPQLPRGGRCVNPEILGHSCGQGRGHTSERQGCNDDQTVGSSFHHSHWPLRDLVCDRIDVLLGNSQRVFPALLLPSRAFFLLLLLLPCHRYR
jgi:hypothetical protein